MEAAKSEALSSPKAKRSAAHFPATGLKRLGRLRRVADVGQAMGVQRGGAANDDEEHDHHAGDAADQHVQARMLVLARRDSFLDEARLQIEKLPGSDGGAD